MRPLLVTLGSDYSTYGRDSYSELRLREPQAPPETLSGFFDFIKATGKIIASPVISVSKGVGHMTMEAGRGIASGDPWRVLTAPVKGTGHIAGTQLRRTGGYAEWYYRPSKMQQWMPQTGAVLSIAGFIPGPQAPFLKGAGAGLMALGSVSSNIYEKNRDKQPVTQAEIAQAQSIKKRNTMYMAGAAGIGALALIMALN